VHGWVTGDLYGVRPSLLSPTHNLHHPSHTQSPSSRSHNLHHPAHTQSPSPRPHTISITLPTNNLHHPTNPLSITPSTHNLHHPAHTHFPPPCTLLYLCSASPPWVRRACKTPLVLSPSLPLQRICGPLPASEYFP